MPRRRPARISQKRSTAAADPGIVTAVRSDGLLDETGCIASLRNACGALGRAPCYHARLRHLLTKTCEKSGLAELFRFFALFVFLAVIVFSVSCAKIADPQPPNLTPPSTVQDLRLEQQENHIILDFSLPSTYVDGQPLELENVAIYRVTLRRSDQPPPMTPAQMEQAGQVIQKLWAEDLKAILKDGRYRFEDVVAFADRNLVFQRSFYYALRFYSRGKAASQLSNMAFISPLAPAAAPDLRLPRVTEQAVLLEWNAPRQNLDGSVPPRVVGYRIFRGSDRNLARLADVEGDARQYADSTVEPELTYYYAVQTRSSEEPPALGPVSPIVSITTTDVFSPAAPEGLGAAVSTGKVELIWEPNSEIDLQGYNVYRSGTIDGEFQKINNALLVVNSFSDAPPGPGTFYYRVTGVDRKGNESQPSAPVSVNFE